MEVTNKFIKKAQEWAKVILTDEGDVSENDRKIFDSVKDGSYAQWRKDNLHRFDKAKTKAIIDKELNLKKSKLIQVLRFWPSVAAILVLGLFTYQAYYLYNDYQRNQQEALIVPGISQAYLEIDNANRVELGKLDTLIVFNKGEVKLEVDKISYKASDRKEGKNEKHKINVPRNAEYYLELSDGTKVWMNSESSLSYLSRFDGKQRIVELSGEAYFEVAKNLEQPFIVRTADMDVRVLGTQFNVKAYPDEDYTYTTLNEGKVRVSNGNVQENLVPDEQLVFENTTGEFTKKNVDATIYSAWVKGKFLFKDERLEDILMTVSRWYDIDVFFSDPLLKEVRFSISLNRYENISKLLEHIELTESVKFEVNAKALLVK